MRDIFLFLIPPAVGALIGFVTNVVAIRMLFRPLKEIRIFGIRLPFTPGILPRQRHRLAQSIGAMVERELLTPDVLKERLGREEVREKIRASLSLFTEKILEKTPGELFAEHEKFLCEKITSAAEKMYPVFSASVLEFLRRENIRREMESGGRIFLRGIMFKLNAIQRLFLSAGQYDQTLEEKMPEIIDDLTSGAENILNDAKVKKAFVDAVSVHFCRMLGGQDKTIGGLLELGEEGKKKLGDFLFNKLMDTAAGQIESLLDSINVKVLVSDRIDSLDILRVERIILDVMADQFKWINIFGGILGFLIGTFQVLFSRFIG